MPTILFAGTKIYLTRTPPFFLNIVPDTIVLNDVLYVLYDVKIDGITIIPKGTVVVGNWVTESLPIPSVQLQVRKILLSEDCEINADSDVLEAAVGNVVPEAFDCCPVRITRLPWRVQLLTDFNSTFIQISTKEICVTLINDLCLP